MVRKFLKRLSSILRAPGPGAHSPISPTETADRLIAEGNRAEEAGRADEACARYREAVRAAPGYAKAHVNFGIGLEAAGDADQAARSYEAALIIDPADPFASYNLGKLLHFRGAAEEAGRLLRQALEHRPEFPEAQIVLASVLESQGDLRGAEATLTAALKLRARDFGALYRYAGVLRKLDRLDEAQAALKQAVAIKPENADASYDLATLHLSLGNPAEAERLLRVVGIHEPRFVDAQARLFDAFNSRGDFVAAARALEAVLEQRPDWPDALYNYGCILKKLVRLQDAENAFRGALAVDPGHSRACRMLGGVLLGQCRTDEALELYRAARERCPDDFEIESAELFALNSSDRIADDALRARHAAFGTRIEKAYPPRFGPFRNARDAERRLRVGYVSGDFCYHVVTLFALPVIERHDRSAVEVFCYSTGDRKDEFTRKLSAHADVWREAASLTETELADAIRDDRIDILVDLAGHSGIPQLRVFAQRPAPVQATWLGYLNTTGMTRIQFRISDAFADPPGAADRYHTETLVRMPHSQWCYRPFISVACAAAPPCTRNGYVTFGSFNQALKISPSVRRLWAEVLKRLPGSRLTILGIPQGRARHDLLRDLAGAGIGEERVTLVPYASLEDYFRWFDAVDIALDTMPYSGGTTTCDALWMGVPVVTAPGSRPSSRSAGSILTTLGLTDWIAPTAEEYVRRAVDFAGEHETLARLRVSLRGRMRASPLMNEEQFTRDLEQAYRHMWRQWCESGER